MTRAGNLLFMLRERTGYSRRGFYNRYGFTKQLDVGRIRDIEARDVIMRIEVLDELIDAGLVEEGSDLHKQFIEAIDADRKDGAQDRILTTADQISSLGEKLDQLAQAAQKAELTSERIEAKLAESESKQIEAVLWQKEFSELATQLQETKAATLRCLGVINVATSFLHLTTYALFEQLGGESGGESVAQLYDDLVKELDSELEKHGLGAHNEIFPGEPFAPF